MRIAFLVLFTITSLFAFSQEKTRRIPITTKEGTKAIVEVDNRHKKIKPKCEITYTWYKAKAILTTQGAYQGDLLHGLYQENYDNKQLRLQGVYKYGVKTGSWRYWDKAGKLIKEENWKNGMLDLPKVKVPKPAKEKAPKPAMEKSSKPEKKKKEKKSPKENVETQEKAPKNNK